MDRVKCFVHQDVFNDTMIYAKRFETIQEIEDYDIGLYGIMETEEGYVLFEIDFKYSGGIGGAAFDDVMRELNRNKSFEEGAKWADEHPNLYSDEKYHTVKVKDLDELNRKAKAYDKLILNTCEWLRDNMPIPEDVVESCTNNSTWYIEDFINNYRKAMEE